MTTITAEMLERGRNLALQDAELKAEEDGLIFRETSKVQPPIVVYSMADGEPIPMSPAIARMAMNKRYKSGGFLFTTDPNLAPEYKLGNVKCFLHPESNERAAGLLGAAGIAHFSCMSAHHPSKYAMQEIAKSKHKKQWEALQEYIREQERDEERAERRQQLEATLALAGKAALPVTDPVAEPVVLTETGTTVDDTPETAIASVYDCPDCDWQPKKSAERPAIALAGHRREKHKE